MRSAVDLVDRMLLADPTARPTIAAVHATLMGVRPPGETAPAPSSGLRGTLVGRARTEAPAAAASAGRLVGKLLGRLTDRRRP
ncbi:hypothetical protein [Rathayibacter sp. VKM Ac-2754]|uniref:hypothetical protein n=1 Tax=Rathayibacter sp. VKM Ac-2754 TaxID=2609251 RepID=UPI0013585BF6|nr:hypothetical protein [Rathayibacter sp. VKM Ac-2754]MWV58931.1 hypothetical protein [Rathayibacter sp. VKM Ac-2754]